MLFFLGGAARTGKGIIARRLVTELGLPYLSLDVLKMGLARGVPEFSLDPDAGAILVAARLWPLVREMSASLLHDQVDYVFEGEILPQDVDGLRQAYPMQVSACFLGYASISPAHKLDEIRTHTGHPNDWALDRSDAELLTIIQREIGFSQYLRAECARVHIPYFDVSHQFMAILNDVVEYVRAAKGLK